MATERKGQRGEEFTLSWLKDVCVVTANRKGTLYFRSGEDRYQMPLETFLKFGNKPINPSYEGMEGQEFP